MIEQPEAKQPRVLRNLWMGFGVVALVVLAYVGYTLWARHTENADLAYKQKATQSAAQRESDAAAVERLGGVDFKIWRFTLRRGSFIGETRWTCATACRTPRR